MLTMMCVVSGLSRITKGVFSLVNRTAGPAEAGHYVAKFGSAKAGRYVLLCAVVSIGAQAAKTPEYLVYVASEAADKIALVRLGPGAGRIDHEFTTGIMPADIDGPHGLAVSPDRRFYYVSLAHGQPYGTVWKYSTKDDTVVGRVTLGMFPATLQTTPDGEFLYVVNFNLHGDMVPSSVSVVATSEML
ncbi:MAG: hypothetical protein C5B57_03470, partial [Blastocatellia bacterium]